MTLAKKAVDGEVVPFEDVADYTRDDHPARLGKIHIHILPKPTCKRTWKYRVLTSFISLGRRGFHDRELVSRPLIRPRLSREIGIIRLRERELTPAAAGLLALVTERLRRPRRI